VIGQTKDSIKTFTDSRDDKVYKTVKIGEQTWMAENLAFKVNNGCWAYANNQSNVTTYGYLYTLEVAKKVCPIGWHLPTVAEWTELIAYLGGENVAGGELKATTILQNKDTNTTKSYDFNALPSGYRSYDGIFNDLGLNSYWWCSSEYNTGYVLEGNMLYMLMSEYWLSYAKNCGFSVRCIKD